MSECKYRGKSEILWFGIVLIWVAVQFNSCRSGRIEHLLRERLPEVHVESVVQ